MSEKEEDAFGGEAFEDWSGGLRPGTTVSWVGKLRYRQGNDPRNWAGAGGSKYLPQDWHMQCGSAKDTFTSRSSGGFELTYPVPFADNPVIIATVISTYPVFKQVTIQMSHASSAVCEVYWWSAENITRLYISWLALGPVGL